MMTADETTRPGFRGKCLYKTGKCNNERALKTSGQAHNLCDEHRHRQNEHQRKLDAKNRYARKDTKSDSKDASPTNLQRGRYMPYGKMRMSPSSGATPEDVHALLSRNGIVSAAPAMTMPFHSLTGDAMASNAAAAAAASQMVGMGASDMMANGVLLMPGSAQSPHLPYPLPMQDFDGIIVPLPSYLEGQERNEIRARVFQKVMDFIAEECVRRYGVPPGSNGVGVPTKPHETPAVDGATASEDTNQAAAEDATGTKAVRGKQPNESTDSDGGSDKHEDDKDAEGDAATDDAGRSKRASRGGRPSRKEV